MINGVIAFFRSYFVPSVCPCCRALHSIQTLCAVCDASIMPVVQKELRITQKRHAKMYAISDYKEPVRTLVMGKYYRDPLAFTTIGTLLWEKTPLSYADFDIIVPVPLHWKRYAHRWFNQSTVIANQLSKKSNKPVVHLLKRVKSTRSQKGLTAAGRLHNIDGAFVLADNAYKYKNAKILFVDDVVTTGTTIVACCKTVLPLRPQQLLVAAACRVV